MACGLGELMTGEVLAAPAGGQRLGGFEAHARIAFVQTRDDLRGAIGRAVVEHDDLEIDVLAIGRTELSAAPMLRSSLRAGMSTEQPALAVLCLGGQRA